MIDRTSLGLATLLIVITAVLYAPVIGHDFITLDDPEFVSQNRHVLNGLSWQGVRFAFSLSDYPQWQPLAWLSLMFDTQLFGTSPAGYHATNVALHLATTLILFFAVRNLTGSSFLSAIAIGLWANHPLHVESVAWISERKGILSSFFFAIVLWLYERSIRLDCRRTYLILILTYTFGLMAKSNLVTIPFGLMLLDLWPLKRGVHLVEKIPMIALSIWAIGMNYVSQNAFGVLIDQSAVPMQLRMSNVIVSYAEYGRKLVWPDDLSVLYPLMPEKFTGLRVALSILVVGLITIFAIVRAKKSEPWILVGWLWYLGNLVPVIGLIQIGRHAMADRYTDVPMLGIHLAIVWSVASAIRCWKIPAMIWVCGLLAVLSAEVFACHLQINRWQNSRTLYEHGIAVMEDNYPMLSDLALVLAQDGETDRSIKLLQHAIEIRPQFGSAHNNLGNVLLGVGKNEEALRSLKRAERLMPQNAVVHCNLARAMQANGDNAGAIVELETALQFNPYLAGIQRILGAAHLSAGNIPRAIALLTEAVGIDPSDHEAAELLKTAQSRK